MVILHICNINNNKASGISVVVPELFQNQKKQNKKIGLINCNDLLIEKLNNEDNVFSIKDLKNYDVGSLREPFNKPDLVVFHDVYILVYIKIAKLLNNRGIPYIIIPHGSLSLHAQEIKKLKKRVANLLLFNKFIKGSFYIQFLSSDEQKMSSRFKHNSFVLGNGISSFELNKNSFNTDKLELIYVGRYAIYNKGLDILLESCFKNKDYMKKNKITLDLYGTNPRSENGYDYIKKYIEKNDLDCIVKLHGPIYDDEKIQQLLNHDIFVQMSRDEGQPLGIMEAMMVGLPIIASEGTTFGNIIENNECGYKCSNPDEFTKAIEKAYNERINLNKISVNCLKYANSNFAWNEVAKKTLRKYDLLIKNRKIH